MDWNKVISVLGTSTILGFVKRDVSGTNLYSQAVAKDVGPEVRSLLRNRGVVSARRAAREALRRRNLL